MEEWLSTTKPSIPETEFCYCITTNTLSLRLVNHRSLLDHDLVYGATLKEVYLNMKEAQSEDFYE